MQYYSLKSILSKNSVYNIIIGERSNGKTYAVLKYAIEQYFKTGKQLAIVRRWQEDIRGRRASDMFTALTANNEVVKISKNVYMGIVYWAGKFYFCNYDDKGKCIYNVETDCFAYTFALSDTEHNKSISYPKIGTVLFDEFLTKHTYLIDEFVLFMNTLSTIIRQRTDVKIFMLGNTVNKYSPYFTEMGLKHVDKMIQGTIDTYQYGDSQLKVSVEYCTTLKKQKKNNFYFAFDNPKLEMITAGNWELDLYPHLPVKYRPKDIKFMYFILFNEIIYQCEIIQKNGQIFTYIHIKTTELKDTNNDLIYTLEVNYKLNYNNNILKPMNNLQKNILWFFQHSKVFYQNNEVGDAIKNFINMCGGKNGI